MKITVTYTHHVNEKEYAHTPKIGYNLSQLLQLARAMLGVVAMAVYSVYVLWHHQSRSCVELLKKKNKQANDIVNQK